MSTLQPCRHIVLTGGASAIGSVLASRLAADPLNNLIVTTKHSHIEGQWATLPNVVHLSDMDLTSQSCLDKLRHMVSEQTCGPLAMIHCVGSFWHHTPLVECPQAVGRLMMESHYLTLYGVSHALLPIMIQRGGGRIVAFSCSSVSYNYPDMAPFTCAKAAVECLVRCIANEYSRFNISANAVALSTVHTPEVIRTKPNGDHDNYMTRDEVSDLAIQLLLEVSPFINGTCIRLIKHSSSFYHQSYYQRNPTGSS